MLLFEFDNGHLLPAQFGSTTGGEIDAEVMVAVRDHVLEIIGKPLFAVQWDADGRGQHAAPGDPDSLIAMDASGQVVTVEVRPTLDSITLVAALAHSGRSSTLGWLDLANLYPSGTGAFRRDWNAFRESLPPRPLPGARLYIVTGKILDEVRPALELLADSGVEVFEVTQRSMSDGRTFVEVTEPYRISVPTIGQHTLLEATRRPLIESDLDRVAKSAGISSADGGQPASAEAAPAASPEPAATAEPEAPVEPVAPSESVSHAPVADESGHHTPVARPGSESFVTAPAPAAPPASAPATPVRPSLTQPVEHDAHGWPVAIEPEEPAAAPSIQSLWSNTPDEDTVVALEEPHPALAALAEAADQELPLVWVQLRKGLRHEAMIDRIGLITLEDGRQFADPSEAAVAASGRHAADGWRVWRIGDGGRVLEEAVRLVVGDDAPIG